MNIHVPGPGPHDRERAELLRLRFVLGLLLAANIAVALFNAAVAIDKVCP